MKYFSFSLNSVLSIYENTYFTILKLSIISIMVFIYNLKFKFTILKYEAIPRILVKNSKKMKN